MRTGDEDATRAPCVARQLTRLHDMERLEPRTKALTLPKQQVPCGL